MSLPDAPAGASPRVAAVVLAAGRSRRMGAQNKLLAPIRGVPMIARVVDALATAAIAPIVVVTGHQAERVRAALAEHPATFAHNPEHARGMSTSIRAGIAHVPAHADAALLCLGDMPWIRADHVGALVRAFDPARGRAICVPVHDGARGHPVLFAARFFAELSRLGGDMGARGLLHAHAAVVHPVPMDDPGVLVDVDTPRALADATGR